MKEQTFILKIIFNNGMDDKIIKLNSASVKEVENALLEKDEGKLAKECFSKIYDIDGNMHNIDYDTVEGCLVFEEK